MNYRIPLSAIIFVKIKESVMGAPTSKIDFLYFTWKGKGHRPELYTKEEMLTVVFWVVMPRLAEII
jgi:hypothetical protein